MAREQRLRQTLKRLAPARMGKLLEVGCGGGFTAEYLADLYESYTGIDHSEKLIRYAEVHNDGPNREFICADVRDFDTENRYDVMLMIGVLHHIAEPEKVLAKLRRLLTPNGVVAVNEPQSGNPMISALRWLRKRVDRNYSIDQVEYSEPELVRLFERAGVYLDSYPQGVLVGRPRRDSAATASARAAPRAPRYGAGSNARIGHVEPRPRSARLEHRRDRARSLAADLPAAFVDHVREQREHRAVDEQDHQ